MAAEDELENALKLIRPSDITVIKSLSNPPILVLKVMEAICVIYGETPQKRNDKNGKSYKDYWKVSRTMLADGNKFLQSLRTFDKDNVPVETMETVRSKYLSDPNFQLEKMRNSSLACEGLYRWIVALEKYDRTQKGNAKK